MFVNLIAALAAAGWTEAQIAEAVKLRGAEITQSSVNRIRNGKQRPLYEVGHALVQLADEVCPQWRMTAGEREAA